MLELARDCLMVWMLLSNQLRFAAGFFELSIKGKRSSPRLSMGRYKMPRYESLLKQLKEKMPHEKEEYDKLVEILKHLPWKKRCEQLEALIHKAS